MQKFLFAFRVHAGLIQENVGRGEASCSATAGALLGFFSSCFPRPAGAPGKLPLVGSAVASMLLTTKKQTGEIPGLLWLFQLDFRTYTMLSLFAITILPRGRYQSGVHLLFGSGESVLTTRSYSSSDSRVP